MAAFVTGFVFLVVMLGVVKLLDFLYELFPKTTLISVFAVVAYMIGQFLLQSAGV